MSKDTNFDERKMTEMREIVLEQLKIAGVQKIGRTTLENMKMSNWWEGPTEDLILRLSSYMLAERIVDDTYEFEYKIPATWWQHFKAEKFPLGWKLRWPVKYRTEKEIVKFVRHATYPMASLIPQYQNKFFMEDLGGKEVIKDHVERQNTQSEEDY
jgi:hypothetical protein